MMLIRRDSGVDFLISKENTGELLCTQLQYEPYDNLNFGSNLHESLAGDKKFNNTEDVLPWLKDKLMVKNATDEDFEKYFSVQHQDKLKKNFIDRGHVYFKSPYVYLYSTVEEFKPGIGMDIYVIYVKDANNNYVKLFED